MSVRRYMLAARYAGFAHVPSGLPYPPAGTDGPVSHRPHNVAPKFGGRLAPLHWLNAKVVGGHRCQHTTGRR